MDSLSPAEDCLFLNVWSPGPAGRKRPVMFYSHGGGFTTGSGGSAYQDGANLAHTGDVVVVASNHRLGLMGYLYLGDLGGEEYATSGNQGMLDIRDALKWVHENIDAFGGDPDNVMIFGESGGGGKTSCLYAMPSAAPYFNKASIESGPGIRMMPSAAAAETTLMLLTHLGLEKSDWRKLLEVPLDKLVAAQGSLSQSPGGGPLTMRGGRKGMTGGDRPGGFGPIIEWHRSAAASFRSGSARHFEEQAPDRRLQPRRNHLLPAAEYRSLQFDRCDSEGAAGKGIRRQRGCGV